MSIEYSNAKVSHHIEDQLPSFVRRDGTKFIDFIKTYYDWLERRIVILSLKSEHDIPKEDILNKALTISSEHYILELEDSSGFIVSEDVNIESYGNSNTSILFNGTSQYGDYNGDIFSISNSWSITCWLKVQTLPSYLRSDYDIITLSNSEYFSPLKILNVGDFIGGSIGNSEINTNITVESNIWNFVVVRYDSILKEITYNLLNYNSNKSFSISLDLSSYSSNRFVVGCDLYNSRNFYTGYLDEIGTYDSLLSNNEITTIFNQGTSLDLLTNTGDYTSNNHLVNYFKFETGNTSVALNSANNLSNIELYHNPGYSVDYPLNVSGLITEDEKNLGLLLNILSATQYENTIDGVLMNRFLAFAEYIKGVIATESTVFTSLDGTNLIIDSYTEAKNPLNTINNIAKFQEIDFVMNLNNFVQNEIFVNYWKELMYGFPQNLHKIPDESIKGIIVKNIKDFYKTKGTFQSFQYLFKILYNEDLTIGTDLYSDGTFSYVIKTQYADSSAQIVDYLNKIVHPVGFNVTILKK